MSVCPYGDWSSLGRIFRSRFSLIWDRLPQFLLRNYSALVHFVVSLHCFSGLFGRLLPPKLRGGHRSPVTSGFTFFYIGLFNCFLICSCQCSGGPRAVKVAKDSRGFGRCRLDDPCLQP